MSAPRQSPALRIHILSDIHLEFGKWWKDFDVNAIDADLTILAGDIGIGLTGLQWALEFERPVIYVMGNHEFYGQRPMTELWRKARAKVAGTHVHLLENESVIINDVRFLGCTLWTDFCLFGVDTQDAMMRNAQAEMTDYQAIYVSTRRASTWDEISGRVRHGGDALTSRKTVTFHQESRDFLARELMRRPHDQAWQKTVVVTHHAPSALSLVDQVPIEALDAAYASNLDALVAQADLWVHGHTHVPVDYKIGTTKVVSNPRGYTGHEVVAEFDPLRVVEV